MRRSIPTVVLSPPGGYEIRSAALSGTGIEKGELVEVDTASGYVGPGPYLIRLDPEERPWPAYLQKIGPRLWSIETTGRDPIYLEKDDDDVWRLRKWGHAAKLDIVGSVERHSTRRFRME